jgi:hypothetical protein
LLSSASQDAIVCLQGIAAAAAGPTAEYGDCVEVLLPLVQQLTRDPEAEIRATVIKQLPGLGKAKSSCVHQLVNMHADACLAAAFCSDGDVLLVGPLVQLC